MKAPEGGRAVFLGAVLFTASYYALRLWLGGHWLAETSLLLPPAFVTAAHLRRAGREVGRARWFFRLVGAAAAIWMVGEVLWAGAAYSGVNPASPVEGPFHSVVDALFIGFLVPMIGAVALGPHPRRSSWDGVALADTALIVTTITFVFTRVVFLPFARVGGLESTRGLLLASETWLLAVWTGALWRGVQDRAWKRTYGFVSAFAFSYGVLSSLANGSGGEMPAAGGPLDVAWIIPLFALGAAALPGLSPATAGVSGPFIVALAGSGPLALDLAVDRMLPQVAGPGHAAHILLLLPVSALLALWCAIRLLVEEQAEARAVSEGRALAEAERRAGRLSALASMSASVVAELERATEEVVAHAGRAVSVLGDKAGRVVSQAQRAQTIVRDMVGAMSLVRPGAWREIDLGTLLEETAREALDEGVGLQISLQGLAGLPPVLGDPGALGAAFLHLVRNAAQASPGGVLRVAAARQRDEVLLRFTDDGPGVPPEVRHRIFDPFFSTRRVGEGVGLGLTLVHSVARDHGGTVVLEPGEGGASFSVRLPVSERRLEAPGWPHWPFAAAMLGSAAIATTLAVIPGASVRSLGSALFQVASAVTAAVALGWTALRRRGRERDFWLLLALGPAIWAGVRLHGLVAAGVATPAHGDGHFILNAVADWAWVAALLLRPDRRQTGAPSTLALLGAGAACSLFGYFYAYFVILPAPMAVFDPALGHEILGARGIQRLAIAAWAAALSWRVLSPYWRGLYSRLAIVFAAWAIGHTLAAHGPTLDSYRPGQILDLGWIVPFLLLGALGVKESLLGAPEEPRAVLASHSPL